MEGQDQARRRRPGGRDRGKGVSEIGIQQINVIPLVAGADYVGPLPVESYGVTSTSLSVLAVSKQPGARAGVGRVHVSPEAAPLIGKSGMEPPPP